MAVTSATIASITTDSGTVGDFLTNDTTLTYGGVYTSSNGAADLFLWIDGVLAGTIAGVSGNKTNQAWSHAVAAALAEGGHTVVINTSNTSVATGVMATHAVLIDTDGTVAASDLLALDASDTVVVDASSVTTLTGTLANVAAAYAANVAGTISGLGNEAVTLSDTTAAATDLNTLNAATTGTVNMATVLTVTRALADLAVTYSTIGFSGRGNEAITLSDATVAATDLNTLDGKTTGMIDASSVTLLTGSVSAVAAASASAQINLANAAFDVTGTKGIDVIVGSAHADTLNGLQGSDTLTGGGDADTFVFSTALNGATNVDTIADFNVVQGDVVELTATIFAGLVTEPGGQLSAGSFAVDGATGAGPQIVYNSATGALSYDSNGAAAGGATQFATLTAPTGTIDEHAFFVV